MTKIRLEKEKILFVLIVVLVLLQESFGLASSRHLNSVFRGQQKKPVSHHLITSTPNVPGAQKQQTKKVKVGSFKKHRKLGASDEINKKFKKPKKEILYLRKVIEDLKAEDLEQHKMIDSFKFNVSTLISLLESTKGSLVKTKKQTENMETELLNLQKNQETVQQLESAILSLTNFHENHINYETGQLVSNPNKKNTSKLSTVDYERLLTSLDAIESHEAHLIQDPAIVSLDFQLLTDIVLLLLAATVGGILVKLVDERVPYIVGYIIGGIFVGPSSPFFGALRVKNVVEVDTLAEFGSVFFLLQHGLGFRQNVIGERERPGAKIISFAKLCCLLACNILTVSLLVQVCVLFFLRADMDSLGAWLIGLSASFGSLSVGFAHKINLSRQKYIASELTVKLLTLQSITTGFFIALPIALKQNSDMIEFSFSDSFVKICKTGFFGLGILGVSWVLFVQFLKGVFKTDHQIAKGLVKNSDLELLITVAFAMAMALTTEFVGIGIDLGCFLTGLILSSTNINLDSLSAQIKPLRTIFASLVFAGIGMTINLSFLWMNIADISIVLLSILVSKFLALILTVRMFGFDWRNSAITALFLTHIGEFSLLFTSKLQGNGLLPRRMYLLFLASTIISLVASPFLSLLMNPLASVMRPRKNFHSLPLMLKQNS
eukprot:snap_masked-scaffold_15-processed-gene-6.34-mRNA-1 protein AED:1.00 eAED:1.00 QI:0/-1/0/0/-1/1/1/0/661